MRNTSKLTDRLTCSKVATLCYMVLDYLLNSCANFHETNREFKKELLLQQRVLSQWLEPRQAT